MPEVVEAKTMATWNLDHLLGRRSGKDDRSHGSKRGNRSAHPVSAGDRAWVISQGPDHPIQTKFFGIMVARDGVEPPTPAFSGLVYVVV